MGRIIIKITDPIDQKDYYMDWSTIVDAPITDGMSLDEFKEYYRREYGESGMNNLSIRIGRVEEKGTSVLYGNYDNVDDFIKCNRAGVHESCLTKEGILDEYCRRKEE